MSSTRLAVAPLGTAPGSESMTLSSDHIAKDETTRKTIAYVEDHMSATRQK